MADALYFRSYATQYTTTGTVCTQRQSTTMVYEEFTWIIVPRPLSVYQLNPLLQKHSYSILEGPPYKTTFFPHTLHNDTPQLMTLHNDTSTTNTTITLHVDT